MANLRAFETGLGLRMNVVIALVCLVIAFTADWGLGTIPFT